MQGAPWPVRCLRPMRTLWYPLRSPTVPTTSSCLNDFSVFLPRHSSFSRKPEWHNRKIKKSLIFPASPTASSLAPQNLEVKLALTSSLHCQLLHICALMGRVAGYCGLLSSKSWTALQRWKEGVEWGSNGCLS